MAAPTIVKKENSFDDSKSKLERLDNVILGLSKKYGKDSRLIRSKDEGIQVIPRWKTSSPGMAYVCGGGYPKGRIIEIYGQESSGKTSLSIAICADVQREGGFVAFVDAEHSFDFEYANKQGMSTESSNFRLLQPDYTEQCLDIMDACLSERIFDIIVVDSVSALTPKAELEGEYGESHMGLQARALSQGLRKIVGKIADSGATVIFINQIRDKIGVMWGSPITTTGGKALKFYSSIRLETKKVYEKESEESTDRELGKIKIGVKNIKNKTAPPFRKVEIELDFEKGFNTVKEYVDLAVEKEIIKKKGSWYSYGEEQIGQGSEKVYSFLINNSKIFDEVKNKVDEFLFPKNTIVENEDNKNSDNEKQVEKQVFPEIEKLKAVAKSSRKLASPDKTDEITLGDT